MDDIWESGVACPVCGSGQNRTLREDVKPLGCVFVECECGHRYYSPRLRERHVVETILNGPAAKAEAIRMYETGSFGPLDRTPAEQLAALERYYADLVRIAREHFGRRNGRAPVSLIEAGTCVGWLLKAAQATIPKVCGCDANHFAVEIGRDKLGLDLRAGTFLSLPFDPSYDIIVAMDYIEHTYTPVEDLKKMYALANPGAVLMVKTFLEDLDGSEAYVNAVHHVNHFSAATLKRALVYAGWQVLEFDDQRERYIAQVIVYAGKPLTHPPCGEAAINSGGADCEVALCHGIDRRGAGQ